MLLRSLVAVGLYSTSMSIVGSASNMSRTATPARAGARSPAGGSWGRGWTGSMARAMFMMLLSGTTMNVAPIRQPHSPSGCSLSVVTVARWLRFCTKAQPDGSDRPPGCLRVRRNHDVRALPAGAFGPRRPSPAACSVNIVCEVIEGAGPNGVPGETRSPGGKAERPGTVQRLNGDPQGPDSGNAGEGRPPRRPFSFCPGCRSFRVGETTVCATVRGHASDPARHRGREPARAAPARPAVHATEQVHP